MGLFIYVSSVNAGSWILNNPYPEDEASETIYYTSFNEQPKTLDPAKSYSANEYQFTGQIYEPVLQYDYLQRPYKLISLTASAMPHIRYYDESGQEINKPELGKVAKSVYTLHIKPGIFYQPHPAFAKEKDGRYAYENLDADYLDDEGITQLSDFKKVGTRELVADDYIYEIKRLANPHINSPIFGLMSEYIEGFYEFGKSLPEISDQRGFLDLRQYPLKGVKKIDAYTFEITVKGLYPQFQYWLAMPFFAPIPWEADRFYSQPDMDDRNLGFGWYPVGTGPFMLIENNPNSRMILERNPYFHKEYFPASGSDEDVAKGYLHHKNERLPLIDKAMFTLEKEAIPRWSKFLQGYYDLSGVSADSFDQAIHINQKGQASLTPAMKRKGMHLTQMIDPTIYYLGFNMLDAVVGGDSTRAKKLRQAISIAINYEENIAIFFNGRGQPAQGPIPPGIFGYQEGKGGINPYVYVWDNNGPSRRPIDYAKILLKEAGYKNGIDPKTGQPLILNYDVPATGGPDDKAQLNWMRKQFAKIGISLNIRATQYNRFQEKMRTGNAQIFSWGWNADYPDPENFLFLLYGRNGKVRYGGENAANYNNSKFDQLFDSMKNRENDEQRENLINKMVEIVREDAPWVWGINTQSLSLSQQWVAPFKPNTISQNTLKYIAIDVPLRNALRKQWNKPVFWPVIFFTILILVLLLPFAIAHYRRQLRHAPRAQL